MNAKKALSSLAAAVSAAVLVELSRTFVPTLAPALQGVAIASLVAVAHWLDAWGHTDRVEKAIADAKAAQ